MPECPNAQLLQDLVDDRLDASTRQQLLDHLDVCSSCHAVVAEVWAKQPALAAIPGRGTQIDHFLVLGPLGTGSMGVVVAAYDVDLDRKVAIKLIRPDETGASHAERRTRLLREAQALAKVSHPNVITVYEVGTFGEQVFIAMELIEGATLGDWLARQPRSVKEVVAMFRRAGAGLAAAHAAGLVHRDFKPDNVLVGNDGRVLVTDFGLVGTAGEAAQGGAPPVSPFTISLTRTGAVVGTPRYMAPEQHDAAQVDGRTDLFAFSAALHEAVYGVPPFSGASYQELADNVRAGRVCEPPRESKVPGWLRRIILRGLAPDPAARFQSMEAMVAELERDRGRLRRPRLAAALGAALLLTGAVTVWQIAAPGACRGGRRRLADIWDEGVRARVHDRFLATGKPFATKAWTSVAGALNHYTDAWVSMHRSVCLASRDGEQSAQALDLRMACLQRRLGNVDALAKLLGNADVGVVEQSVSAVAALPPLDGCSDLARLSARVTPPLEAEARKRSEAARRKLAEAQALHDAGKYAPAVPLVTEVLTVGKDDPPLAAEALFLRGRLEDRLGDPRAAEATLFAAVAAATRAGHFEVETDAQIELVNVAGVIRAEVDVGQRSVEQSAALLTRLGSDPVRQARLERYHGFLLTQQSKYEDARARFLSALAIEERLSPTVPRRIAAIFADLGKIDYLQSKYDAALESMRRSLTILENTHGGEHPDVGVAHANLGSVLSELPERRAEAVVELQRALAIQQSALGPAHPDVAATHANLGDTYWSMGRFREALAEDQQAIDISGKMASPHESLGSFYLAKARVLRDLERFGEAHTAYDQAEKAQAARWGPADVVVAQILESRANLLVMEKRYDDGFATYDRARAIFEKVEGPTGVRVGMTLDGMADVLMAQRRVGPSNGLRKRARAILEKELPPDSPDIATSYVSNGERLHEIGADAEALRELEHGVMILEKRPTNTRPLATARFSLATIVWSRDRARAVGLARLAQRDLAAAGKDADADRKRVETWLNTHIR